MKKKERISLVTAGLIVALAVTTDFLQGLLTLTIVGSIAAMFMGVIVGITLWLIFTLHGVKYSGTGGLKKIGASFGTMVLEMIPFVDALPLVTTGAVLIIVQTRREDAEEAKKQEEEQAAAQKQAMLEAQAAAKQAANDNNAMRAAMAEAA